MKAGQLLAVIAAPEIDQQLDAARSNLATAQANLELAQTTMNRYQGVLAKHAVSQQDVDNAVGTYRADQQIVNADKATVGQYEALVAFENIYAPFDGVITARNTDIGDLINSGNSGNVKTDLFHIAQTGTYLIPVNTLIFRSEGLQVGIVKDGKVVVKTVMPGHDLGQQIEIVGGLDADDQVGLNPPDSLITGQAVHVVDAVLPGDVK